jgi:hypothetical protein
MTQRIGQVGLVLCIFLTLFFAHAADAKQDSQDSELLTVEDKAFFAQVKDAILNNDRNWIAAHIYLPLNVFPIPGKG